MHPIRTTGTLKKGGSNCFSRECSIWPTIFFARVGWCAQSMRAPMAVLNESFLSDAFAGREGKTPPFKGRAQAAPALCKTTLVLNLSYIFFWHGDIFSNCDNLNLTEWETHPNQGTYISPPHVTTSYGTWGGAVSTPQNKMASPSVKS
jgi:hypothetical protein